MAANLSIFEDISRAFIAVLQAPREIIHDQAFNVGITSENYQIRDLAEIVHEVVPDCRVEFAEDAGPDKRSYRVDFSKISKTLPSFKPRWNARQGAQQLYEAYRKTGLRLEEFEGPRYRRIDCIQTRLANHQLDSTLRWQQNHSSIEA